jgi:hypothetical protein
MTNGYEPASGYLRLTDQQIKSIQAKYAHLWHFVSEQGDAEARLVLIVKQGKLRFVELEFSADDDLNGQAQAQMPESALKKADAKLSSLCGLTEQTGGEARLIVIVTGQGDIQMRAVLGEELTPLRRRQK